ncbi:sulfotransferase-like domain-containing protein [Oscillatoria salina]|uniref:sulfotransferase-like domain-containing protein n=1 Tax=Oscillatoria salina TaxID=331517 RepID=UPI0013B8BFC7|nr:hypothetical protein [Oscillatoria salina]MBZ8178608.1 hypothetical protein [Oscillatoria salina IIICB1]NET91506.1 hypothetical protein [Kamptonema sp. SIO1D9]
MSQVKRIAMWSSIRSLSTAMMRAWSSHPDTIVWDEPLYAVYLAQTKANHPYAEEILAKYETDFEKVIAKMTTGEIPNNQTILFQKHISDSLLVDEADLSFLSQLTNFFLIRNPQDIITSLYQKLPDLSIEDTGISNLKKIFDRVRELTGNIPPVVDARDLQNNPQKILSLLCESLGVDFSEKMLSWSAGKQETDGIWGKHWYQNVEKSTCFLPYRPKLDVVPKHLLSVVEECNSIYQELYQFRLR